MRWGTVALVLLPAIVGCYPEFGFAPRDADPPTDDTAVVDAIANDASNDAIFPVDDTAASTDSASPDTFVPPTDMGVDTTPPPSGCAGLSGWTFCRDFDSATTPGSGWVDTYIVGGGSLTFDTTYFRSATKSLRSSLPASSGVESAGNAHTTLTASSESRQVALDFWVRFSVVPSGDGPMFAKIARASSSRGVTLYVGRNSIAVDASGPTSTTNYPLPRSLSTNTWYHVRLETLLSTTSGSFKLFVDDMTTAAVQKSGIPTAGGTGVDIKINAGFYNAGTVSAMNAWFDDVAVYWL